MWRVGAIGQGEHGGDLWGIVRDAEKGGLLRSFENTAPMKEG